MITSPHLKWFGLALLSAVQFMVVLDIAIVNVALPSIQTDLHFSQANLQWVISAYALVFGGFLLLGGRTADMLGRRRRVRRRHPGLHPRLAAVRSGLVRHVAHRRAGHPGPRCGGHLAGCAGDPDDVVQGRPRPQHRARRLGCRRRLRRRRRRAARRRPDRLAVLGVDLLRQHPGRAGRADPRAGAPEREPGRTGARLRHRSVPCSSPAASAPWSSPSRRATAGAGLGAARSARSPPLRLLVGFVVWENRARSR